MANEPWRPQSPDLSKYRPKSPDLSHYRPCSPDLSAFKSETSHSKSDPWRSPPLGSDHLTTRPSSSTSNATFQPPVIDPHAHANEGNAQPDHGNPYQSHRPLHPPYASHAYPSTYPSQFEPMPSQTRSQRVKRENGTDPITDVGSLQRLASSRDTSSPPRQRSVHAIEVKTKFPAARIKRIMQADEDVGKVAQVSPIAMAKALELFMIRLISASAAVAKSRGSKRVLTAHMKSAVLQDVQFDFLHEQVNKVPDAPKKEEADDDEDDHDDDASSKRRKKSAAGAGFRTKRPGSGED